MCEFSVLLGGEEVFKDVVYARTDGSKVILKDILGDSKVVDNCRIAEINVSSERLVLSPVQSS
jgi:predicted RNA-binding protein